MERGNKNTENRKRSRDDQEDGKDECHASKKQETNIISSGQISSSHIREKKGRDRYTDTIFDFPWLKDGSGFEANEFFEHERDMFAPCNYSCLDIVEDTLGDDHCFPEKELEGDGLRSFQVDDFEPLDCVWSFVIDQPVDTKT